MPLKEIETRLKKKTNMPLPVQFQIRFLRPRLWRFVCVASTVTGLVSYALSSSFKSLFGHWNILKILLYGVFSSIICFAIFSAKVWRLKNSTRLMREAHLSVTILTITTVYLFFYDEAVDKKPDAYSLISCAAFAIMSLSLSRQTHFGFEVDLMYFFLGSLILQLMKIKLWLAVVGVGFSYSLIILRSSLDAILQIQNHLQQALPHSVNIYESHDHNSVSPEMETMVEYEISSTNLKHALVACAKAVADTDLIMARWLIDTLRQMVSVSGEPIKRLGAYVLEGLVARLADSGRKRSSIYESLRCNEPTSSELLSDINILYEICPYFKFGYMSANGAIAESMKDEDRIHIIDFKIAQGTQWTTLIQALADRPGPECGPPHIRITGVDYSASARARRDGVHIVGQFLSKLAEDLRVPFEFHSATFSGSDVEIDSLEIRPMGALAVNFAFMTHHMFDGSASTQNHRDRLLRLVKSLSPKVVTLVEHEFNPNTAAFFPRFVETLDYYSAIFESLDVTLPRDNK